MTIFASLSSMSGSFKPTGNSAISKSLASSKTGINSVACGGCGGHGGSGSIIDLDLDIKIDLNLGGLLGGILGGGGCHSGCY